MSSTPVADLLVASTALTEATALLLNRGPSWRPQALDALARVKEYTEHVEAGLIAGKGSLDDTDKQSACESVEAMVCNAIALARKTRGPVGLRCVEDSSEYTKVARLLDDASEVSESHPAEPRDCRYTGEDWLVVLTAVDGPRPHLWGPPKGEYGIDDPPSRCIETGPNEAKALEAMQMSLNRGCDSDVTYVDETQVKEALAELRKHGVTSENEVRAGSKISGTVGGGGWRVTLRHPDSMSFRRTPAQVADHLKANHDRGSILSIELAGETFKVASPPKAVETVSVVQAVDYAVADSTKRKRLSYIQCESSTHRDAILVELSQRGVDKIEHRTNGVRFIVYHDESVPSLLWSVLLKFVPIKFVPAGGA